MASDHQQCMRWALEEAETAREEGNMAVGSVIVRDGQLLVRGHNEANSTHDITAHAETVAIRRLSASLRLANPHFAADFRPLVGCALYTTVEPCPMCGWAICMSGISTLVIGARLADLSVHYGEYALERLLALAGVKLEVISGVLGAESVRLRASQRHPGA